MSESTILECPICFEDYSSPSYAPVSFPCGHSCCIKCGTSIFSRPHSSRLCHQCRNHIPDDTKLSINYALRDIAVERASIAAASEAKTDASKFDETKSVSESVSTINIGTNSTIPLQDLSVEDVANLMRHLNVPSGDIENLKSKQVTGCDLEQCDSPDDIKECGISLSVKAKSVYKAISGFKVSGIPINFLSCSTSEDKPTHSRNSSAIESRRLSSTISSYSGTEITASESSLLSANISSNFVKEVAESKSTLPLAPPVLPPTQNQNAHVGALVSYHPVRYAKASGIFSSSFKWERCQAKERNPNHDDSRFFLTNFPVCTLRS